MRLDLKENVRLYFFSFFLYCVIGWIYEVVLGLLYGHGFVNRGFLLGPYLPVYGFGVVLLLLLLKGVMSRKRYIGRLPVTPLLVFVLIVFITTIVEFFTSWALEAVFDKRWWDYSADFLNIDGRVCPRTSFRFGLGGMVLLYGVQPLFSRLIAKVPDSLQKAAMIVILAVMLTDLAVTLLFMI